MPAHSNLSQLCDTFSSALSGGSPRAVAMEALLIATSARAVGLWELVDSNLIQWGFAACPEMPAEVARDFAAATKSVPVSKDGLGIVRAVNTRVPTVATLQPEITGLPGSAGWIARFGATHSLSAPLIDARGVLRGALAVSTLETLEPSCENWERIVRLADHIAGELAARE